MTADSQDTVLSLDQIETAHDTLLFRRDQLASPLDGAPQFWTEVNTFLAQARHGGILLDRPRDRRVAQGILDYWASALVRAGEVVPDVQLAPFDFSKAPKLPDEPCPYRGLAAFDEPSKSYFFGRETLVVMLRRCFQ